MERVYFELESGEKIMPYETFGIFLKAYDALPPTPKTYMVDIEGADGSIDLSEWTGDIHFQNRIVSVQLLDTIGNNSSVLSKIIGQKCKIYFSDDMDYYYVGRCNDSNISTRRHISDITLSFMCDPWKYCKGETVIALSVTGNGIDINLRSKRKPVIPSVVLTASCNLIWENNTYNLDAGTYNPHWLVVKDTAKTLNVSGSGIITLRWRDGVI